MAGQFVKPCGLALLLTVTILGCAPTGYPPVALPQPKQDRAVPPAAGPILAAPESTQAFHGLGTLAFTRDGRLYLLNDETDQLREVAGAQPAGALEWSADGRFLAFRQADGEENRVMLVEAATGKLREVPGTPGRATGYAWAPEGSGLAVSAAVDPEPDVPLPTQSQVWVIPDPADARPRFLASAATPIDMMRWSPDGSQIAWVRTLPYERPESRSDALEIGDVKEGQPVRWWYVAEGAGIDLAGWWPDGQGLLYWIRPSHCVSCAADGRPLHSMALATKEVVDLPIGLLYPGWLSSGPGQQELLMVQGGGRPVWDAKSLARCDVRTGACEGLPQPEDAVSLDPALSPDGRQIALVRAKRRPGEWGLASEEALKEWVDSRTLWLILPDGSEARQLTAAGGGIYSPAWSGDGRHLLYVKDDTLWALNLDTDQAAPVVDLGQSDGLFGFYGHRSWWSHRIAWHRPR